MATWKKVIVSGSDAELNTLFTSLHVTSSANISASGFLYGNLPENDTLEYVVVYNDGGGTHNGRLERKILNLVNAQRAPELYLADLNSSTNDSDQRFRLSYDSGSDTGEPITPPIRVSASLAFGLGSVIESSNTQFLINGAWDDVDVGDDEYYLQGQTNETASVSEGNPEGPEDARNGLLNPEDTTPKETIRLVLQSVNSTSDTTATPAPSSFDYDPRAFDSPAPGDSGEIRVYVNTMDYASADAVFDIGPTIGAVTAESNGITPNISVSQSNMDGAEVDATKCYRTGDIEISTTKQLDGYNYAFIFYTGSRGDNQVRALTNFIEWFYDEDGANFAMSITNGVNSFSIKTGEPTSSLSGVRYYTPSVEGTFKARWSTPNQYRNIYPVNDGLNFQISTNTISAFSVTQSGEYLLNGPVEHPGNAGVFAQSFDLAALDRNTLAHTQVTRITASADVTMSATSIVHHPTDFIGSPFESTYATSIESDVTVNFQATHINKANTPYNSVTFDDYLINGLISNSNVSAFEDFRDESFRIISRSYATTDTITNFPWKSTENIGDDGINGHNTGLLEYASHLVYPNKAGVIGDGGNFDSTYGPTQLYDYSSGATQVATGEREYFRYFELNQNGLLDFNIELKGTGKLVGEGSTLFNTNGEYFKMYVWRENTSGNSAFSGDFINVLDSSIRTGASIMNDVNNRYLPLTNTVSSITYADGDYGGGVNTPLSVVKFNDNNGTNTSIGEHLIVKIVTPEGWTGYLDAMALTLGAAPSKVLGITYTSY